MGRIISELKIPTNIMTKSLVTLLVVFGLIVPVLAGAQIDPATAASLQARITVLQQQITQLKARLAAGDYPQTQVGVTVPVEYITPVPSLTAGICRKVLSEIKEGEVAPRVSVLQQKLSLTATGRYGATTREAFDRFCASNPNETPFMSPVVTSVSVSGVGTTGDLVTPKRVSPLPEPFRSGQTSTTRIYQRCKGDLDSNGMIAGRDVALLATIYGKNDPFHSLYWLADMNSSGGPIDQADLGIMLRLQNTVPTDCVSPAAVS